MSDLILPPGRRLLSRRGPALLSLWLLASWCALAVSAAVTGSAFAQKAAGPTEVSVEELMKPGELPDVVLGPADAKVTVVEYASMTCGHCAKFHTGVFPEIRKKYIDTGKIRFVMREFPLDNLAAATSMLARCASPEKTGDKTYALIDTFFAKQADWAFKEGSPVPRLFEIAKQAGFTQESFDKCLTDQKLLD
ncbi:MAG: thioredoxin domain-containing protein, partial [Hyphomicrobium sp.]